MVLFSLTSIHPVSCTTNTFKWKEFFNSHCLKQSRLVYSSEFDVAFKCHCIVNVHINTRGGMRIAIAQFVEHMIYFN